MSSCVQDTLRCTILVTFLWPWWTPWPQSHPTREGFIWLHVLNSPSWERGSTLNTIRTCQRTLCWQNSRKCLPDTLKLGTVADTCNPAPLEGWGEDVSSRTTCKKPTQYIHANTRTKTKTKQTNMKAHAHSVRTQLNTHMLTHIQKTKQKTHKQTSMKAQAHSGTIRVVQHSRLLEVWKKDSPDTGLKRQTSWKNEY